MCASLEGRLAADDARFPERRRLGGPHLWDEPKQDDGARLFARPLYAGMQE